MELFLAAVDWDDGQAFTPVDDKWQDYKCQMFALGTAKYVNFIAEKMIGDPTRIVKVESDGHCFYRVI